MAGHWIHRSEPGGNRLDLINYWSVYVCVYLGLSVRESPSLLRDLPSRPATPSRQVDRSCDNSSMPVQSRPSQPPGTSPRPRVQARAHCLEGNPCHMLV
ncbi:hypothetical protein LZ31DRAFT_309874 [Colletotrichum somersetense]|nr:hypothetical protein LZ31DRAFT_309874 [Colletotrichum somersetense]